MKLDRPPFAWWLVCAAALATTGCELDKSKNPLSPDVAGPLPGVSITAPAPIEPAQGARVESTSQPLDLRFQNPTTNGERALWLEVEVAIDAQFGDRVHTATKITPGADGQTAYRMPAALEAGRTYYWRARGLDGANTGPFSAAAFFDLVVPVVLETPVPLSPVARQVTGTVRPALVVNNGAVIGPAGAVQYRFEVALDQAFAAMVAALSVPRGAGGSTTAQLSSDLAAATDHYWRVRASDGTSASDWSLVQSFRTPGSSATPPVIDPSIPVPPAGAVGPRRTIPVEEALSLVRTMHDRMGVDLGSRSTRDSRVAFFFSAVAAIHYGHPVWNPGGPDPDWCVKDAGGGRPPSDDVIARCGSRDAWDLILSAGADGYQFHLDYIGRLPGDQNVYPPPQSSLPR
jgi:hypothetical protein